MPRHFRLEEAERLLAAVEPPLRRAVEFKQSIDALEGELRAVSGRIQMLGGARVAPGPILEIRRRRKALAAGLKQALEQVEEQGCLVKDLDLGLVDFPARFEGREVCLCWKLGEPRIEFWHGADEGFRGRKRIGREFVDGHEGGEES